jgi:hypothetical protein
MNLVIISQKELMKGMMEQGDKNLLPEVNRLSRDLLHIHTAEDVGEDDAHLVPGKVDADAGVLAGGEGVVGVSAVGALSVSVVQIEEKWAGGVIVGYDEGESVTYSNLGALLSLSGESSAKNLSGQKRWG